VCCYCEKLVAKVEIVWKPRGRETSTVGSRYRALASEDVTVDTSVCKHVCVSEWDETVPLHVAI
jgi:hypothetical protein